MRMIMKPLSLILLLLFLPFIGPIASAQINIPKLSPHSVLIQEIGFNEITIDYSRPSVRGRVIFGDLVPFGQLWRTGANASTKIKFKDDVIMEGHEVPAGEYALYAIPEKDEWTIVLHTITTYWGVGKEYKAADDLIRFKVKTKTINHKIETMAIEMSDMAFQSCNLEIKWDHTLVKINIKLETDTKVMTEIDDKMKGISQATYYQSAVYYLENDKDLNKALEWIDKALFQNEQFWILRQKAMILAKLERFTEAIAIGERALAMAKAAENTDYTTQDEAQLAAWRTHLK